MRESLVERKLTSLVKERGGWAIKFVPSVSGLPDRIVLLPTGRFFFVELKAPKGVVAPHQKVVHSKLKRLGFPVAVLSSVAEVEAWMQAN